MTISVDNRNQGGVALLQVLLLSMVISLLLIQLVYTARGQLALAGRLDERVRADLIIHSAKSEALFALLVDTADNLDQKLGLVASAGQRSAVVDDFRVSTSVGDVAGLLPLRYPSHPFWPSVLDELGVDRSSAQVFLRELRDMQDADNAGGPASEEPQRSSVGFLYPNAPVQTVNSLKTWFRLDASVSERLTRLSHHYEQAAVNLEQAPEAIKRAVLDNYETSLVNNNGKRASPRASQYVQDQFGYWVDNSPSGIWRVHVSVNTSSFSREKTYDLHLTPRRNIPFSMVAQ